MRVCCNGFLLFAIMLWATALGLAQKPGTKTDTEDTQKGFTEFETFQGTANSDANVLKLDSTVGYDFNKHFGIFAGVPVYFSHFSWVSDVGTAL